MKASLALLRPFLDTSLGAREVDIAVGGVNGTGNAEVTGNSEVTGNGGVTCNGKVTGNPVAVTTAALPDGAAVAAAVGTALAVAIVGEVNVAPSWTGRTVGGGGGSGGGVGGGVTSVGPVCALVKRADAVAVASAEKRGESDAVCSGSLLLVLLSVSPLVSVPV